MSRVLQVGDRIELSAKGRGLHCYRNKIDLKGIFVGHRPRAWWQPGDVEINWDGSERISVINRKYIKKYQNAPSIEDFI